MYFRQLEAFVTVYDTRSYGEAARSLFITQPAVSKQVKTLEDELGVQLFARTRHAVAPTEAGETFIPYARQLLLLEQEAVQALSPGVPEFYLHFVQGDMHDPMQQAILRFTTEQPMVKLQTAMAAEAKDFENASRLLPRHLYLARQSWIGDKAIRFYTLGKPRYQIVLCREDPLCARREITFTEAAERCFIRLEDKGMEGPIMRVLHAYLQREIPPERVITVPGMVEAVARIINDRGRSVYVLPYFIPLPPSDRVVRLPFTCALSDDLLGLAFIGNPTPQMSRFMQLAGAAHRSQR
ncbi:MAG: LysR family transcriptional regulator [Clostridia bacterium]|nr:LysR family transcriptional regulator [Clostridia bacterium]